MSQLVTRVANMIGLGPIKRGHQTQKKFVNQPGGWCPGSLVGTWGASSATATHHHCTANPEEIPKQIIIQNYKTLWSRNHCQQSQLLMKRYLGRTFPSPISVFCIALALLVWHLQANKPFFSYCQALCCHQQHQNHQYVVLLWHPVFSWTSTQPIVKTLHKW